MQMYSGQSRNPLRFEMFPPVLRWIIGLNVLVFLICQIGLRDPAATNAPGEFIIEYGALWPIARGMFIPWQYVTHMFVHLEFGHVFFNMLALWMFGVELANLWGAKRFTTYYFLCGIGAGVIHSIWTYFMGDIHPAIGASGAVMGVVVGFAVLFPKRIVYLSMFIPMPAKYAAIVFVGIDLFMGVTRAGDGVAHFAHLGGAAIGFLTLWLIRRRQRRAAGLDPFGGPTSPPMRQQPSMPARIVDLSVVDARVRESQPAPRANPVLNFGDDQALIDSLLDKANREGYNSLTDDEKERLIQASRRIQ